MSIREMIRMLHFFMLALVFYYCALHVENPQIQTAFWKAGHITLGSYAGYQIDRHLFGRYDHDVSYTNRVLARAIVVGCAIMGMAFGL